MKNEIVGLYSLGFNIVCYSKTMTIEEFVKEVPEEDITSFDTVGKMIFVSTVSEEIACSIIIPEMEEVEA